MLQIFAAVVILFTSAAGDAAETYYRAGKYDLALAEYEKEITQKRPSDPNIYYNAGNCAFRLQQFPQAALYYHRALLRDPRGEKAKFNLRLTERKLAMAPPAAEGILDTVLRFYNEASPGMLLILTSAAEAAGLALIVLGRRRRGAVGGGIVILIIAGICAAGYFKKISPAVDARGLVVAPEIKIYSEPRDDLPVLVSLKAGELLTVVESTDRWARVVHGGRSGWTPRAGVGLID